VGDDDGRVAELALQHLQLAPHPLTGGHVQVRQRLVEQQHRRVADQRTGEGDALLLPAGQARGPQIEHVGHLEPFRQPLHALVRVLDAPGLEPVGEVLAHVQGG
jgi:hypothetical protein